MEKNELLFRTFLNLKRGRQVTDSIHELCFGKGSTENMYNSEG